MNPIIPTYRSIKELLQSRSFAIDDYQREYKWDQQNIEELISDLQSKFEAYYRDGDGPQAVPQYGDYFLGSIITTVRDNRSYLVDGQQRVTSLTLLLIYLYRASKERNLDVKNTIEPLIFSDNFGDKKFNLDIAERTPIISALFNGEIVNTVGMHESNQTIVSRYQDIENSSLAEDLGSGLSTFIYWLINKVGLIEISTESDAHAYSIFETMNDRGKPLSPVDMLKAYLLGPITEEHSRSEANRIWKKTILELITWGGEKDLERDSSFMKAWLRAKYAESIRERKAGSLDKDWELIGSIFHRWLRDNAHHVGVGDAESNSKLMTSEFPFFKNAYEKILNASRDYTPGLESVYYNAHNDFTWQNTVLLAPLNVTDSEETVTKKIAAVATYLDIWLMRRVVNYVRVGYSSASYTMWSLCREIRDKNINELVDILRTKLESEASDISFEGSESRGREGVKALNLNQFSRRYIYHLLARLTSYTEANSGQPDLFDKYADRKQSNPYDIEHIWADNFSRYADQFESQQEFNEYRNSVAGLLLLPADVNRSYQDIPFNEKVAHYAGQNLYAASLYDSTYQHNPQFKQFIERNSLPFKAYNSFNKEDQIERRDLILKLSNLVWSPERLNKYRQE